MSLRFGGGWIGWLEVGVEMRNGFGVRPGWRRRLWYIFMDRLPGGRRGGRRVGVGGDRVGGCMHGRSGAMEEETLGGCARRARQKLHGNTYSTFLFF